MRLIDLDKLNSCIAQSRISLHATRSRLRVSDIVLIIQSMPIIDAVPVVRCRDCKWYDLAFYVCSKCGVCVNRDFYCADGEKGDANV